MGEIKRFFNNWSWADYGIVSLLLVFCAYNRLMPILMVITCLSLFTTRNDLRSVKRLLSFRYPFVWFIIYFLAHLVGLLYTANYSFALADIGMKMSFILIPLFLIFTRLKISLKELTNAFLIGLVIACIMCYSYAIFRSIYYPEDNHWGYFKESYFSFMMHRSYFATYLALGTLISIILFFENSKMKGYYIFTFILFFVSTMLTFSKAGIVILILQLVPLSYYLIARRFKVIYGIVGTGLVILVTVAFVKFSPNLNARFSKMIHEIVNTQQVQNGGIESNATRLTMWATSYQLIKENVLMGVGTGDVKDALNARNMKLGNTAMAEHNFNAHNQYLNTGVQLGFLGLIPLLGIFVTSLIVGIRRRNIPLIVMLITFMITMFFESFLETQAGIIPVTLLSLLFTLKAVEEVNEAEIV